MYVPAHEAVALQIAQGLRQHPLRDVRDAAPQLAEVTRLHDARISSRGSLRGRHSANASNGASTASKREATIRRIYADLDGTLPSP